MDGGICVTSVHRRLEQENHEFEDSLDNPHTRLLRCMRPMKLLQLNLCDLQLCPPCGAPSTRGLGCQVPTSPGRSTSVLSVPTALSAFKRPSLASCDCAPTRAPAVLCLCSAGGQSHTTSRLWTGWAVQITRAQPGSGSLNPARPQSGPSRWPELCCPRPISLAALASPASSPLEQSPSQSNKNR